ncbi:metal ABC transporter solute-binding protein, Zn/Mn family [Rhodococcus gannanensis]|uniref:Metal ABC transporter solute-binding protein, Zn/Mn family n=1 Tax=Rhodococcus gannanensis TaxID=1960308 RepID=A0ABW4PC95_9NOCA
MPHTPRSLRRARTRLHGRTGRATAVAVGLTTAAALVLAGCSSTSDAAADGRLTVVASTNVWGSVASAVAGEYADVTSIISEPSADPHSYEASPRDAAAVTDADLVVYNGGGYDEFVEDILAAEGDKPTVNAYELLGAESDLHAGHDHGTEATEAVAEDTAAHDEAEGHDSHAGHSHGGVNEHVWYDIATVDTVAHAIAAELGDLDPANAAAYTANAESFHGKLHSVADITADVAARHAHTPVAQTEPTAHYLLAAADLDDRTPEDFTRAIEEGNDPPPAAIAATRDLLSGKQVAVLVYNNQTEDKVTRDMRSVAEAAGVPVVEVTETLPEGVDYVQWQLSIAEQLAAALDGAAAGTPE